MAESRRAEVACPNQRAAKQMRPGYSTKSNPSRAVSWGDLSRDRYIACPKLASPAGNTFARGPLEFEFRGKNCVGKGA